MKKLLICLFLGSAFSLNIAAGDDGTTVTTYYGAKASSSANNPCKGATIRVCGTIETKKITVSETSTIVSSIVRDADGIILSRDIQLVDALDEKKTIGDIFDIQRITDIEVDETDE